MSKLGIISEENHGMSVRLGVKGIWGCVSMSVRARGYKWVSMGQGYGVKELG